MEPVTLGELALADEDVDDSEIDAVEPPLAIDMESKSDPSDEGDDGWNETYVLTDEETLEDVARAQTGHRSGRPATT